MPWEKKNPHLKRSRLQEKRGAETYNGTRTPGSGNGWIKKADVRTVSELFEFKTTTHASFSLKTDDLRELWKHAILDNRIPVFEIEFANDHMEVVVLDKNDYLAMRENGN